MRFSLPLLFLLSSLYIVSLYIPGDTERGEQEGCHVHPSGRLELGIVLLLSQITKLSIPLNAQYTLHSHTVA